MTSDKLQLIEERIRLAASRGFTIDFQLLQESQENVICHKKLAPATDDKYYRALANWELWRLSRNESKEKNFSRDEPDPTPQILKLFAEDYIATRKKLPSQQTACHNLTSFTSLWERETSRTLPDHVKKDVLNHIRNVLTPKYGLPTKPRDRAPVTAKDLEYLLRRLFGEDSHDYKHERARVQTGSALSLFAGSGARAGAIVESSSYTNSNECLYYKHLSFNIKWSDRDCGFVKRWVTIDPEFLKGWRYRDDVKLPKNWFREHPVLGFNFVFWVIVHGIADGAFKGISSVDDLLAKRPPVGRESWTLQWSDSAKELPFFRMITPKGPSPDKGLTFSAMHHNNTALAERDGFKDALRIHGIRSEVANRIDPKASEATRGQALDHQNHDTYLKYQAQLKSLDVQALFYNLEPDYECRDMEQSMAHHRDPNVPQHIDAAALAEFESDAEVLALNEQIAALTKQIAGQPAVHRDLDLERRKLYSRKAKKLEAKRSAFIAQWWEASYDEYIAGNDFSERDTTCLFDIYKKYMPERSRLRDNLFKEISIDSDEGKQCLQDMVSLCTSTEKVAYYPGLAPKNGRCPTCLRDMSSTAAQARAKHILQCRRQHLDAAPYQQCYKNGKRAHRRTQRQFVQFCYHCAEMVFDADEWERHCQNHLENVQPRCGILTFRYTTVAAGLCPFCLGDESKAPSERFKQWMTKATLLNHIDDHLKSYQSKEAMRCPHPLCQEKEYKGIVGLRRHFYDVHSITETRSNCVTRKRRWPLEEESSDKTDSMEGVSYKRFCKEGTSEVVG